MGGLQPRSKRRLVIVGASFAGLALVDKLKNHFEITLVERKDHFEYICNMPKFLVEAQHFLDSCSIRYETMLREPSSLLGRARKKGLKFIQASLQSINPEKQVLTIVGESGNEQDLKYDVLALCTGNTFAEPVNSDNALSQDERYHFLDE